jgi:hypothetical protein
MKPEITAGQGTTLETTETAHLLTLASETTVFALTAQAAAGDELEWVTTTTDEAPPGLTATPDTAKGSSSASFTGAKDEASFVARVKGSTKPSQTSLPVQVKVKPATPPTPTGDKTVVDVEVGEFDPLFTVISGAIFATFAVLVVLFAHSIIEKVGVPPFQLLTAEQIPLGSWTERIGAVVVLATTTVGTVLLLIGAWLAALEVRGRLRRKDEQGKTIRAVSVKKGLALPSAEDLAKVMDAAGKLRGTIAVLFAGVAILLGSLWAAAGIDADQPPPTTPQTLVSSSEI